MNADLPSDVIDKTPSLKERLPIPQSTFLAQRAILDHLEIDPNFFAGYDFSGWPLTKVNFPRGANLNGARFAHLNADYAGFTGCKLEHSTFYRVRGRGARFDDVSAGSMQSSFCDFTSANFDDAVMPEANVQRTCFNKCSMEWTLFERSAVRRSSFLGVDLSRVVFRDCKFENNDLRRAQFDPRGPRGEPQPDNFTRMTNARFIGNWYSDSMDLPAIPAIRSDAARHRLASWLFGTAATTAVGFAMEKGYQYLESNVGTEADIHAMPGYAVAFGAIFMFGAWAKLEERLHEKTIKWVMSASGGVRIGMQAAKDYFSSRANLIAVAGSPSAGRLFRNALMSVRGSWVPDPYSNNDVRLNLNYRSFALPNLNIIICDRDHAEMAINALVHRMAPIINETIITRPVGQEVCNKAPAAIGITKDHNVIATYNLGPGCGGDKCVVCFYDSAGGLKRIEQHPKEEWEVPDAVKSLASRGADAVIQAFVTALGETEWPRISPKESPDELTPGL